MIRLTILTVWLTWWLCVALFYAAAYTMGILLAIFTALVKWWRSRSSEPEPPRHVRRSPVPVPDLPAPASPVRTAPPNSIPRQRIPRTSHVHSGPLFTYGGIQGAFLAERYAVIDFETTGLSPDRGDRVIEVAVVVTDAHGQIVDEYATLVNPEGRDVGATFIHRITNEMVSDAPLFLDVVSEIVQRINGSVVVAHNAAFDERFLLAELTRIEGFAFAPIPALCSMQLARKVVPNAANHKLSTLCESHGIEAGGHAALGDARATAQLLAILLKLLPQPLRYTAEPVAWTAPPVMRRPVTRAPQLSRGEHGWMHSMISRLPMSSEEADDIQVDAYLSCLSDALADGKITGDEIKMLKRIAGAAGMGAAEVRALNERFLETMREAAFADDVLTSQELGSLRSAATALAAPGYFNDLEPTSRATLVGIEDLPRQRRCGHCREIGHYRPKCPQLAY